MERERFDKLVYFSANEVSNHCFKNDCWISVHGIIFDLTPALDDFIRLNPEQHGKTKQLLKRAGKNLSSWFQVSPSEETNDVVLYEENSPRTLSLVHDNLPGEEVMDVANESPISTFNSVSTPWWKNSDFIVGKLSKEPVILRFINLLLAEDEKYDEDNEFMIEVCSEEVAERFVPKLKFFNSHLAAYVWKRLDEKDSLLKTVDLKKTLQQNGFVVDANEVFKLGLGRHDAVITIFLDFEDDFATAE